VVDRVMPEGEHLLRYDAGGLPGGIYVWRLYLVVSRQSVAGKLMKF
jgi:hypothetical protein